MLSILPILAMPETIGLSITLPKQLVEKIDHDRGDIPRSRFLLRLIQRTYTQVTEEVNTRS